MVRLRLFYIFYVMLGYCKYFFKFKKDFKYFSVVLGSGGTGSSTSYSVSENCTYLVQPLSATISPTVIYNICPSSSKICRIRLDFLVSGTLNLYFQNLACVNLTLP
jgi:hypothetical protein